MIHDLTTERVPVAGLRTYHRNPRQGQTKVIASSLRVNGQYRPVVVNRGTHTGRSSEVLAGNHTLMAARDEGWAEIAVCWVDVDDDAAARIVAADNRTADLGEYDDRLLAELLSDLPDLDGTGYDPGDLDDLLARLDNEPKPALNDPDDVPPTEATSVSRTGDVWHLGPHRLVVGDATDPLVWERLLGDEQADMVWTDPPYGVSYQADLSPEEARRLHRRTDGLEVTNDKLDGAALEGFLRAAFTLAYTASRDGACWYVTAPPGPLHIHTANVLAELQVWRQTLTWVKDQFVMGRSDYHYRHEPIFYGWTRGAGHHRVPDRKQDSVHEVARPKRSEDHPTMKPVALIARHVENSTDAGQLVVDPFAGSGSTLIACHGTGRRAALIELDPRYADVICRRYQDHTGTVPARAGVEHDFTG